MSNTIGTGDDNSRGRVRRSHRPDRPTTTTTTPRHPRAPRAPREARSGRSDIGTRPAGESLDREPEETASDPRSSRHVTGRQASASARLTGDAPSFAEISAQEEQDVERDPAAAEGRPLLHNGEDINPSDAHLYRQAEEGQPAPVDALEEAGNLRDDLRDATNPNQVINQQMPAIMASLEGAEPEVVSQTMSQLSTIAHENPQLATALAQQFGEHPPANLNATLEGLAGSSAAGRPELAGAIATLFESQENPTASQFRSVSNLADAVTDINGSLESGNLQGAGQAADRISSAIADAPPEVAQALLAQLDTDGSLGQISSILDHSANDDHVDGEIADFRNDFQPNNPLAELGDGDTSDIQRFDRVIGSLSQAVTAAGDDDLTQMVAGHVTNAVGDNIRRFDESFTLTIANAGGAGLAGAVATQLQASGNTDMANKVAESVEDGFDIYLERFDQTADRVDQANNDLAYQLSQWGPFYGDDEAGQAALNEQVEAFQEGHPEYDELNRMSATAGGDLEVLRQLQDVFPEKEDLHRRELSLLAEVPRFGQTESGRRSLGEAVARRGDGEQTFLDRLDDQDFLDSLPDDYYQQMGYEDREGFQSGMSQQLLNGSLSLMAETTQRGDMETLDNLESGILEYHEMLGEDRDALAEVLDANRGMITASAIVGREGSGTSAGLLDEAANRYADATSRLHNPATANRFRAGGALAAAGAGVFSWWANSRDGLELPEALESTVDTFDSLLAVGGAANQGALGSRASSLFTSFSDDFVRTGGRIFGAAGALLDGYSMVRALQDGDWGQAGISAVSVAGGIATALGATGVGLALGLGAAALGLGYAQYQKVEASNRFETPETEAFIRGALEHAGVQNDQLDEVVRHLRNADDEGRNVGILISQAAQRRGMEPIDLLAAIARQNPDQVLDIVETGHGIDPQSGDLHDLPQTHETDSQVGQTRGTGRVASAQRYEPRSVEGFLVYLENEGII